MADDAPTACPECQHPWSAHGAGGCLAWPEGEPPCTCKREPPEGGITLDWGGVTEMMGAELSAVDPDGPPPLPYGSLIIRGPDGIGRVYRPDPETGELPYHEPDVN